MSLPETKQALLERYNRSETVSDQFGRAIMVKRLRASEQLRVLRWANSDDHTVRLYYTAVAATRGIDGLIIPFPQSDAELTNTIDLLDREGIAAAISAYAKVGVDEEAAKDEDAAKNSPATQPSVA